MILRSSRILPRYWRSAQQKANETGNGSHLAEVAVIEKLIADSNSEWKLTSENRSGYSGAFWSIKNANFKNSELVI